MQGGPGHSQPAGHRCKRAAWSPLALSTLPLTLKPETFLLVDWTHSLLPESSFEGCEKLEEERIREDGARLTWNSDMQLLRGLGDGCWKPRLSKGSYL